MTITLPSGMKTIEVETAPKIKVETGANGPVWRVSGLTGRQPVRGHMHGFFFENKTYYTDLQHVAEQFARENNLVIT